MCVAWGEREREREREIESDMIGFGKISFIPVLGDRLPDLA